MPCLFKFLIMSTASRGSISPGQVAPQVQHHAPMSERQQLALIKRLELAATTSNGTPNNGEIFRFRSAKLFGYILAFSYDS